MKKKSNAGHYFMVSRSAESIEVGVCGVCSVWCEYHHCMIHHMIPRHEYDVTVGKSRCWPSGCKCDSWSSQQKKNLCQKNYSTFAHKQNVMRHACKQGTFNLSQQILSVKCMCLCLTDMSVFDFFFYKLYYLLDFAISRFFHVCVWIGFLLWCSSMMFDVTVLFIMATGLHHGKAT